MGAPGGVPIGWDRHDPRSYTALSGAAAVSRPRPASWAVVFFHHCICHPSACAFLSSVCGSLPVRTGPVSGVMNYEDVPVSRICQEIHAAVPDEVFQYAKAVAAVDGINRLAAVPHAAGDVLTHLTRPRYRGGNSNEWVHRQADIMTIGLMQRLMDRTHAASEGNPPAVFKDWAVVDPDDRSQRHLAFKLYVMRRLKSSRSTLRRILYHAVLYYLFHGDEDTIDISMSFPDTEKPEPCEARSHRYFAYTAKRLVGPTARVLDTDEEDAVVCADGTTVRVLRECLFKTSEVALQLYATTLQPMDVGAVFAIATLLRNLVMDGDFDWHALTPADHQGLFISGPGAYRLLLPRTSTREKIDRLMYTEG